MALNLAVAAEPLPVGDGQTLVIGSSEQTRGSIHQRRPTAAQAAG